jgi:hypothetical protein
MNKFITLSASLITLALGAAPAQAQYQDPSSPYTAPLDSRVAYYASDSYFQRSGGTPEKWIAQMCHDLIGRWPAPVEVHNWVTAYYGNGGNRQVVAASFLVGADTEVASRSAPPSDSRIAYYASDSYFQRSGGTPEQWIAHMCHDLIGRWPAPVEVRNWVLAYYGNSRNRQAVAASFLVGADAEVAARSSGGR